MMLSVVIIPLVLGVATVARTDDDDSALAEKVAQVFTSRYFPEALKERHKHGENSDVVFSGLSLLQPLAQLTLASTGESHNELMSNALGLADDADVKSVSKVYKELFGPSQEVVTFSNKVYYSTYVDINTTAACEATELFHTYFEELDFTSPKQAANVMNNYIESTTEGKINYLIKSQELSFLTDVVLVSSVYFKSEWENKFKRVYSKLDDFFYTEGESVSKKFMFQQINARQGFSNQLDAELLQLNFKEKGFFFNIALPKEVNALPAFLQKFKKHDGNLYAENNKFLNKDVQIYLPKFEINTGLNLKPVLESLGVTKIFSLANGNLRNLLMNKFRNVAVYNAIQKVYVHINEEGAEVASAEDTNYEEPFTGTDGGEPVVFRANLPFYYEFNYYGYTLFNGIVNFDPRIG